MTRKHFLAIAEAIRHSINSPQERATIAKALSPALLAANPKFDADRFFTAAVGK